jgi:hypothetical protein
MTVLDPAASVRSVTVNGESVAQDRIFRGMFLRHRIDITEQIAGAGKLENLLQITVTPPDHVGCVDKG